MVRQAKAKHAALAGLAIGPDLATMGLDHIAHQRQAQAQAFDAAPQRIGQLGKIFPNRGQLLRRYANACIRYFQDCAIWRGAARYDDATTGPVELDSIMNQMVNGFYQPISVAV